jgi:hypothetical protein
MAGESRRLTHEKHADVLGKDLAIGRTLPRTVRYLLPYLAREPLFAPLSAMLTGLFHVGVRLRWLCLETFAARGLGSLETQRGALEAPRES